MNVYRAHFSRFSREPRGERFEQMLDRLKLTVVPKNRGRTDHEGQSIPDY